VGRLFRLAGEHRKSLREIDAPTQTGVASPRLSASLFVFTGLSQRRPDNGGQSQPNFSLREFSIAQMIFPEGNNLKLNRRGHETQLNRSGRQPI
jgi:hypothetical protein